MAPPRRQMQRGARASVDQVLADHNDARDALRKALRETRTNPGYVEDRIREALQALDMADERMTDDVEPLLLRRERRDSPPPEDDEQRLEKLEHAVEALRKQLAGLQGVVSKDRATG